MGDFAHRPSETDEEFYSLELARAGAIIKNLRARWERERKELMTGVAVIVAAAGGEVRVPRRLLVDPPHEVQRVDDLVSDSVVFRVRQAQPTEGQEPR